MVIQQFEWRNKTQPLIPPRGLTCDAIGDSPIHLRVKRPTNLTAIFSHFQSHDGGVTHSHRTSRHRSPTAASHRPDPDDSMHLHTKDNLDDTGGTAEADTSDVGYTSSFLSNGSSEHVKPDYEADTVDAKTTAILDHLNNKIVRVKDLIRTEQKLRDGKLIPTWSA